MGVYRFMLRQPDRILRPMAPFDGAARRSLSLSQWVVLIAVAFCMSVMWAIAPRLLVLILTIGASVAFLVTAVWKTLLVMLSVRPPITSNPPAEWPKYTVLAALYREAEVIDQLVERLSRLDYPPDRLQGLLILEACDHETINAAMTPKMPSWRTVIIAPPGYPQTKPRALNCALPLVTGDLITVYDAEDAPDPGQLKECAARFAADSEGRLACLQAPLRIRRNDTSDRRSTFIDRQFAAEYAALFETTLPGMSRLGLPFPLGGTSNHFRVPVLRGLGGWDAWNVTEDADMGFRLWRQGWRLSVIASPTWETPPGDLGQWLPQRTRWLKGYMQTWGVHTRHPSGLGVRGTFSLITTLGAALVSAALYGPSLSWFFTTLSVSTVAGVAPLTPTLALCVFGAGTASAWLSCAIGARRAGIPYTLTDMAGAPFYWAMLSLAFVHAVWRLFREPFAWNKTTHAPDRVILTDVHQREVEATLDEALPVRLSATNVAAPKPLT